MEKQLNDGAWNIMEYCWCYGGIFLYIVTCRPPGQLPNLCLFNLRRRVGCFMMTSHEVLVAKKQIRHLTKECLHSWVYQESIHTLWGNWIVLVSRSWSHWKYLRDKAKHKHNQTKTDVYTSVTFVPAEGSLPAMGQEMINSGSNWNKKIPILQYVWAIYTHRKKGKEAGCEDGIPTGKVPDFHCVPLLCQIIGV